MTRIEAHISGTVWRVEVHPGDHVDAGQTVIVLESKKLEMPVEVDEEGTVTQVLVEEGQDVSEGDPLLELE